MAFLHYFNPGNESAILNTSPYYTPAANQVKMQRDLAFLPAWYADSSSDCVWIEDDLPADFVSLIEPLNLAKAIGTNNILEKKHSLSGIKVSPWGISPQSVKFFENLNIKYELNLQLPQWKSEYLHLSSRVTAKKCLEFLIQSNPEIAHNILPEFYSSIEEIENTVETSEFPLLAKIL